MNDEIVNFMRAVLTVAAKIGGVSETEIRAHVRFPEVIMARYISFKIIKDTTRHILSPTGRPVVPTALIGKVVGDFDHATVLHGLKTAKIRLGGDPKIKADPLWMMTYSSIMEELAKDGMEPIMNDSFFPYNLEGYNNAKAWLYDMGEFEMIEGTRDQVIYNANKKLNEYRTC